MALSFLRQFRIKNRKGFTLVELLVVIAIIGILAGVVLVSLNGARRSARDTKRISDMRAAQLALELYYSNNAKYPAAAADATCENFSVSANAALGQTYSDPTAGANYQYAVDKASNPQNYVVKATLENTTNDVLNSSNDKDGVALGCACDDPGYCLQP